MLCPVCQGSNTGKVGSMLYYCASCLLEYSFDQGEYRVYYIDAEGQPIAVRDRDSARKLVSIIEAGFEAGSEGLLQKKLEEPGGSLLEG